MDYESLKFFNYKLFKEVELRGLDRVNVIIGKNNSGKSSLIDVIGAAYDANYYYSIGDSVGDIIAGITVTKQMISDMFNSFPRGINSRWNSVTYPNVAEGKRLCLSLNPMPNSNFSVEFDESSDPIITEIKNYWISSTLRKVSEEANGYCFRRMRAERDIAPEAESNDRNLDENGEGATNLIQRVMLESKFDEKIIEDELLSELNRIMYPDSTFEAIKILQTKNVEGGIWEVYLQEKGNNRIPLSKMGSGLKTIILILLNLLVLPQLLVKLDPNKYSNKRFVFAFEEIENNLHPALQRRIFEYLYSYAEKNDVTIFITTHSHVAINCFFGKEQASIYHIEKTDGEAEVKRIETYLDKVEILSDLDVRASDLLQSNGIIWVEGPSDRIYIKRWLELFSDNKYVEGQHFQFMYYGGRNLANFSADEQTKLVSILTTNRNAAIVIDSDKKQRSGSINDTKRRIVDEFARLGLFSWVTKGKEIENYIPVEAINKLFKKSKLKQCGQYDLFPDYIKKYYSGFTGKKVQFANEIAPYMDKDECSKILDLKKNIKKLYGIIEKWNE